MFMLHNNMHNTPGVGCNSQMSRECMCKYKPSISRTTFSKRLIQGKYADI